MDMGVGEGWGGWHAETPININTRRNTDFLAPEVMVDA